MDDAQLLLEYIQSTFASMGIETPAKADGKLNALRAKGMIIQWVFRGQCLDFSNWKAEMMGVKPERDPWPPQEVMPWPPVTVDANE